MLGALRGQPGSPQAGTTPSACAVMVVRAVTATSRSTEMAMPAVWPLMMAALAAQALATGGPPNDADGAQRQSWPGCELRKSVSYM